MSYINIGKLSCTGHRLRSTEITVQDGRRPAVTNRLGQTAAASVIIWARGLYEKGLTLTGWGAGRRPLRAGGAL